MITFSPMYKYIISPLHNLQRHMDNLLVFLNQIYTYILHKQKQ